MLSTGVVLSFCSFFHCFISVCLTVIWAVPQARDPRPCLLVRIWMIMNGTQCEWSGEGRVWSCLWMICPLWKVSYSVSSCSFALYCYNVTHSDDLVYLCKFICAFYAVVILCFCCIYIWFISYAFGWSYLNSHQFREQCLTLWLDCLKKQQQKKCNFRWFSFLFF